MTFFDDAHNAATTYEHTAEPLTAQCIEYGFETIGGITPGASVLDVAAGPGALSVAAAHRGAHVLATDLSATMVARIKERLVPYPHCSAAVMDAQSLGLPDDTFDATFSMFGVINLPDWRRALRELARVTRAGGHGCISSWRDPQTVASVGLLVEAMSNVFPERSAIPVPDGVSVAADPEALHQEMTTAGFGEVVVRPVPVTWEFPSVNQFIFELDQIYGFLPAYSGLSAQDRHRLTPALRRAAERRADDVGVLRSVTTAHIAVGRAN